jgi:hypothetical protein
VGEHFVYHRAGRDYPTTVDIDDWIQQDERLRAFHEEVTREATLELANGYAGSLLITVLSDHLDDYLKTQAKNLVNMREALNGIGVLAEGLLRTPEIDEHLVKLFMGRLTSVGGRITAGMVFDRNVDRAEQIRAIMASLSSRLMGGLKFARNVARISCDTLTSDAFLLPVPAEGTPFDNPTRLAALGAWALAVLDDMRDGCLRRYEQDEAFVRAIIGDRAVKRFASARESARKYATMTWDELVSVK